MPPMLGASRTWRRSWIPAAPLMADTANPFESLTEMQLSIIAPAHNEEAFLPGCLASIEAARPGGVETETLVVLNRCTDRTEEIARAAGAVIVNEDARSLARIRNAGAARARGEWLVTIDADSRMSPDLLTEVAVALRD